MDPRKGKANYGEAFRQNLLSTLSDHQSSQRMQSSQQYNQSNYHQQQSIKPQFIIGKQDNFRLVSDPLIIEGCKKVISINGVIPGVSFVHASLHQNKNYLMKFTHTLLHWEYKV